jgi:hypothetical protein
VNNIIELAPKTDTRRYRRIEYTLTYVPVDRLWAWEFYIIERTRICGRSESMDEANTSARTHIDLVHGAGA